MIVNKLYCDQYKIKTCNVKCLSSDMHSQDSYEGLILNCSS